MKQTQKDILFKKISSKIETLYPEKLSKKEAFEATQNLINFYNILIEEKLSKTPVDNSENRSIHSKKEDSYGGY